MLKDVKRVANKSGGSYSRTKSRHNPDKRLSNTFFFLFSDPEIQTTQAGRQAAGTAEGKNEGDHPKYKQCPITVPPIGIKRTPTSERQNTRGDIITDRCSRALKPDTNDCLNPPISPEKDE